MERPGVLDKGRVRAAFDRAAAGFAARAVLHAEVRRRLLERLDFVRLTPNRVVDLGGGTGDAARALKRRYPKAQVVNLDLAPAMLRRAKAQSWWRPLPCVAGDIEALPLATRCVDLAFSNLALGWCNDLELAFGELQRVAAPGGLLMFSLFGPDTLRELRHSCAAVDPKPRVHAFLDMHDVGDALLRGQWGDPVIDVEHLTLTYAQVADLLAELRATGGGNALADRPRGLWHPRSRGRLFDAYEAWRQGGRLPATFEIVYGHAWAPLHPPQRRRTDGAAVIAIDALKRPPKGGVKPPR
ncbi:MAG: methyltransferase domain-containing protein [Candidatus Competibacterales bacterium]